MDWTAVGKLVLPMAPTIGSILGGLIPIPGGSLIGQEAGQMLAQALGVPNDPTAIGAALGSDPNAAAKIQAAESEASAKWSALAQIAQAQFQSNSSQADSINQTMRSELAAGQKWYAWRNLYGYSVTYEVAVASNIIFYAILFDHSALKAVQDSFNFFLSWYTLRFGLLGYLHNQATNEKVAAVTGQAPAGLAASIVRAVRGK